MSGREIDLAPGADPLRKYRLAAACGNCGWTGSVLLAKGRPRPRDHRHTVTCPDCECKSVRVASRLWGEDA